MRYFTGFLIVLCSVIFWLLPVSDSIYAWKTEPRTDTRTLTTAAAVTTANTVLLKPIFDNDVSTLSFASDLSTDVPAYVSYNTTSRLVVISGLTANASRVMGITYDVTAFDESTVFEALSDATVWLLYIFFIVFPMGGIYVAFKPDLENIFA